MKNSNGAYNIHWGKKAVSYLERLDKPTQKRIISHVECLADDPSSTVLDIRPVVGHPGILRLRVGKYRIIYSIEEEIKIIAVSTILPRGEVYKGL